MTDEKAIALWFWIGGKIAADKLPVHDPPVAWRVGDLDFAGAQAQVICVPSMLPESLGVGGLRLPVLLDGEPGRL